MSRGSVFGSIVASVVIMAAIAYVIVPIFVPPASGTILQTRYIETSSYAVINDPDTSWTSVPDTALNISTRGNSKIHARFAANVYQYIDGPSGLDFWRYNISLVINGTSSQVMNDTIRFGYSGTIPDDYQEFYCNSLTLEFTTPILPAAQYTIFVKWISLANTALASQLHLSIEVYNRTRTLWVEEIAP